MLNKSSSTVLSLNIRNGIKDIREVMRDATASWSGYLYQSIIGLVVGLEYLISFKEEQEDYSRLMVSYEQLEDFSICQLVGDKFNVLEAHQVKNYKDDYTSKYVDALRHCRLGKIGNNEKNVSFFLHTNVLPQISDVKESGWRFGVNHEGIKYRYRNGSHLIGAANVIQYLKDLIREYFQLFHEGASQQIIDIAVDSMISRADELILTTKLLRDKGFATAQGDLTFVEMEQILIKTLSTVFTGDCIFKRIKTELLEAVLLFNEDVDTLSPNVETFHNFCISSKNTDLKNIIIKICPHVALDDDLSYSKAMGTVMDIMEGLLAFINSTIGEANMNDLIFNGRQGTYRPTPLRLNVAAVGGQALLKRVHIPNIIKNISDSDVRDLFRVGNITIIGQTVENIWDAEITKVENYASENKITEPELKRLVNVNDAIEECSEDD